MLLRAGRLDLTRKWLAKLAERYATLPTSPSCRPSEILRQKSRKAAAAIGGATGSLVSLNERGLPVTAEALSYAADLTERLDRARRRIPEGLITPSTRSASIANPRRLPPEQRLQQLRRLRQGGACMLSRGR